MENRHKLISKQRICSIYQIKKVYLLYDNISLIHYNSYENLFKKIIFRNSVTKTNKHNR